MHAKTIPTPTRLPRHDLLHLLDRSAEYALTLILAPPGYGKSTLLSQWANNNKRHQVRLSLSRRDADPLFFLQRLNDALRDILPNYAMLSCNALSTSLDQANSLADSLADSLATSPEDFWMLIDDFHFATAPLIQLIFARLLDNLPPAVHIVLFSRTHPSFPLSRLKLEDRLLIVDGHDLRLSAQQLPELCERLGKAPLSEQESLELMQLTEGWLAGIRLALMARERTGRFMPQDFQGSQHELVDYFTNVVLADLPADERDLLLATAIFERFDAALCAALPGVGDSYARLNSLLQKGLFLQKIEELPGWYRYHPLLQHVLQNRLHLEVPNRITELHLAAAHHFFAMGDEELALFHAKRAGNEPIFIKLLRIACERWLKLGKLMTILNSLDSVAPELLHSDPDLFVPQLAALIFSRQFDKARLCLDDINNSNESLPQQILDTLDYLQQVLTVFQKDNDLWQEEDNFNVDDLPYHDIRDSVTALIARHLLLHGQCEDAIRYAGQARLLLDQIGHVYLSSFTDVIQLLSERELGHIINARQLTQDFWNRHSHQPKTPSWINAGACMAVSLYEQNRVAEARELCEELIQHVDSACITEIVFHVYVTLARLHYIAGHHNRGAQLLLQLRRILRHGRYYRLLYELLAEELAQALRSGQPALIKGIVAEYDLANRLARGDWDEPISEYREDWVYGGIAAAHYLRSRKEYSSAIAVLQTLELMLERSEMKTRRIVAEANRIVITHLRGQSKLAIQGVVELFARVGLQCAIRTVFDEAPNFGELLRQTHDQGFIKLPDIYLQLYANVLQPIAFAPSVATYHAEPLTAKEIEVIELVRQGFANKEISRKLNISLSTTKWHLKNIFAKLQVSNRTSAMTALNHAASIQRV